MAVIVTGTAVELMQLAEPKALPCVLLIETSIGSDTDQITLMRLD